MSIDSKQGSKDNLEFKGSKRGSKDSKRWLLKLFGKGWTYCGEGLDDSQILFFVIRLLLLLCHFQGLNHSE